MKAVVFSLFGSKPKYLWGAWRNAELVPEIYPGFETLFYYADSVPDLTLSGLLKRGAKLRCSNPALSNPIFNRYLPLANVQPGDVYLFRDADSRVSMRESWAVAEWLQTKEPFHVMRDHPLHSTVVMGGMWGAREGIPDIQSLMNTWGDEHPYVYGDDPRFLHNLIWPRIMEHCIQHDPYNYFPGSRQFPSPRLKGAAFVGEIVDENEQPNPGDRERRDK